MFVYFSTSPSPSLSSPSLPTSPLSLSLSPSLCLPLPPSLPDYQVEVKKAQPRCATVSGQAYATQQLTQAQSQYAAAYQTYTPQRECCFLIHVYNIHVAVEVSNLAVWVSNLAMEVSNLAVWVSNLPVWVSNLAMEVSNLAVWVSNLPVWVGNLVG